MWEWDSSSSIIISLLLFFKQKNYLYSLYPYQLINPHSQNHYCHVLNLKLIYGSFERLYAFAENGSRAQNFQLLSTRKLLFINPVLLPCTLFQNIYRTETILTIGLFICNFFKEKWDQQMIRSSIYVLMHEFRASSSLFFVDVPSWEYDDSM